jgi:hypothetical protein
MINFDVLSSTFTKTKNSFKTVHPWFRHIGIGSCISSEIKMTPGVPQGSHLGALSTVSSALPLIFKCVRALFNTEDMKLFLPVESSHA